MKKGFSLLESLITLVIILILSGLLFTYVFSLDIKQKKLLSTRYHDNNTMVVGGEALQLDRQGKLIFPNKPMYKGGVVMKDKNGQIITQERYLNGVRP